MITDFLKTSRTKRELKASLAILRDFKACESREECLEIPFMAWAKLEQLEEFLEHLVEGKALQADTIQYRETGSVDYRKILKEKTKRNN